MAEKSTAKTKTKLKTSCEEFAHDTTCHGVGGCVKSKNVVLKVMWMCALCLAFGLMSRQVIILIIKYRSWGKVTKVEVKTDPQDFPTVSICNLNPFLKSDVVRSEDSDIRKLRNAYVELKRADILAQVSRNPRIPGVLMPPTTAPGTENTKPKQPISTPISIQPIEPKKTDQTDVRQPPRPRTVAGPSIVWDLLDTPKVMRNKTKDRLLREALQMSSMQVPTASMQKFGHRVEDMVHWCRFLGHSCSYQNFSQHLTYSYGNCYSFNSAATRDQPEVMGRSGNKYGLKLVLNVQKDEYLPVLSSGTGVHVVIHQFNTKPFPAHDGYSIAAGFNTKFGITVRKIERLGAPYGKCLQSLGEENGHPYTATACVSRCVHLAVLERCGCYRYGARNQVPKDRAKDARPCTTDKDIRCYLQVNQEYARQNFECDCLQPCVELEYSATSDLNEWPSDGYLTVLQDQVCRNEAKRGQNKTCQKIKNEGKTYVKENFLALSVFFKQLNYEHIVEEEEYLIEDLLSDVGGTLGLYAGISLLTGIEIVAFAVQLVQTMADGFVKEKRPMSKQKTWEFDNPNMEKAGNNEIANVSYSPHSEQY